MRKNMINFSPARQRFYQVLGQPEAQISLAEAALYLAQEEYPELDVESYLNALDTMAEDVRERLPIASYPLRIIQTINQYLYDDLGFIGNRTEYYDPRNSYLNEVIERRTGIPITLSLVYLEIAKRIDFPMAGVGMPGHFLIRPSFAEMEIYVDPFQGGEILFSQDCQERLAQIYNQPFDFKPEFLLPIGPQQFLARMLTNLKYIYLNQNQLEKSLAAVERILLIFPESLQELRDRGILYYQLGRWREASQDLAAYLDGSPGAEDVALIRQLLARLGREV